MSKPDFSILDWTDAQIDAMFLRAEAKPIDAFLNSGHHRFDLQAHEIFNDQRWKGFMPKDLPATEATARLTLGFAKQLWRTKKGYGGETQYFGGSIATNHTIEEITLDRQTHDLPAGRYVLIGYTDPIFQDLFYDLLKPIDDDFMLFRGYTGQFPNGKRGWTAVLLRRYPFAQMGIDDHQMLFNSGSTVADDALLGTWRVDALYYSNLPVPIARLAIERAADGQLTIDCDTSVRRRGVLLPKFAADHFQTGSLALLRDELRVVDGQYLVGKWTTAIRGPYAKLLLAGAPGLFHAAKGPGRGKRFALYYLFTRVPAGLRQFEA